MSSLEIWLAIGLFAGNFFLQPLLGEDTTWWDSFFIATISVVVYVCLLALV